MWYQSPNRVRRPLYGCQHKQDEEVIAQQDGLLGEEGVKSESGRKHFYSGRAWHGMSESELDQEGIYGQNESSLG